MQFARHYTRAATAGAQAEWSPSKIEQQFVWKQFQVSIKEGDRVILEGEVEAPMSWSQQAVTILAHKYLRKAGVPSATTPIQAEASQSKDLPRWLCPKKPSLGATFGAENSARQVFRRLAGHWAYAAFRNGYFDDPEHPRPAALAATQNADGTTTVDHSPLEAFIQAREANAQAFYDEVFHALATQMAAPNSPQWFNTGLWWSYGIEGSTSESQRGYIHSNIGGETVRAPNTYEWPQTSACFILGLRDSLLGEGGILDTVTREARIFKYGSGSGVNYSSLRAKGAPLSNGGSSSGLMSFLRLFDSNAGTIKSGGTTRRAARMAIVDTDHPEAEAFAIWKAREEVKAGAMIAASKLVLEARDKKQSPPLSDIEGGVYTDLSSSSYEGEAITTVSGQNANNSLRASDAFMRLVGYDSKDRVDEFDAVNVRAQRLWNKACTAAWACGDPGFQFDDTINRWHTIPKVGRQRATNPCSEYAFIDDSSCNLASLNLAAFWVDGHEEPVETERDGDLVPGASYFDVVGFSYLSKLWTVILDVSVGMSSFPDPRVAENSVNYRAVGLGYANLGGLLMLVGVPYDSEEARTYAGLVTAVMHGSAWEQSSELAKALGAFNDFDDHREDVDRVLGLHRDAAQRLSQGGVAQNIGSAGTGHPFADCLGWVHDHWLSSASVSNPLVRGGPIRNAQLTLLAPTGTIGLVMGCDATGIEPVYMLTAMKKLAGGGSLMQEVGLLPPALRALGYSDTDAHEIIAYIQEHGKVGLATPHLRREHMSVFDCANDIEASGHLGMMAAVQPFLSGAISKTVNLPNTATIADVADVYTTAWKLGLKAIALYRDGCKVAQPLTAVTATSAANQPSKAPDASSVAVPVSATPPVPLRSAVLPDAPSGAIPSANTSVMPRPTISGLPPKGVLTPRYKLPSRRSGWTQKVTIAGYTVYLRTGEFPDGRLGEIFLTISRDGSTINHMASALAITMSLGLQHGVPLQEYVDAFTDSRAEPSGIVQGSDTVRMCSSVMDYVVRELAKHYLHLETNIPVVIQSPEPRDTTPSITVSTSNQDTGAGGGIGSFGSGAALGIVSNSVVAMGGPVSLIGSSSSLMGERPGESIVPVQTQEERSVGMRTMSAQANRYNGQACNHCHAFTLRRSGTCHVCDTCGETSGCS